MYSSIKNRASVRSSRGLLCLGLLGDHRHQDVGVPKKLYVQAEFAANVLGKTFQRTQAIFQEFTTDIKLMLYNVADLSCHGGRRVTSLNANVLEKKVYTTLDQVVTVVEFSVAEPVIPALKFSSPGDSELGAPWTMSAVNRPTRPTKTISEISHPTSTELNLPRLNRGRSAPIVDLPTKKVKFTPTPIEYIFNLTLSKN